MKEDIMKIENVLPEDFDGTFRFTNPSDEEFVGKWGGKEYHFAANSTSPMIMPDHSPLEIQHIRKKFAKDLAQREFFKSQKYSQYMGQERNNDGSVRLNSIHQAATYNDQDLVSYIQACLKPLQISKATVTDSEKEDVENKLSRNEEGDLNTVVVDKKTSLRAKALANEKIT